MSNRLSIIHKVLYTLGVLIGLIHFALVLSTMVVEYDGVDYSDPSAARIVDGVNAKGKAEFDGLGAGYYAIHLIVRAIRPRSCFVHIASDLAANFILGVALIIVLAGKFVIIDLLTAVTAAFAIIQCAWAGIIFFVEGTLALYLGCHRHHLAVGQVLGMSFHELATLPPGANNLSQTASNGKESDQVS